MPAEMPPGWHQLITHTYIRTYIHTYIHTYIRTYIHTYIHACMHTYVRTYIRTCIHTYSDVYLGSISSSHIHTHMYTHTRVIGICVGGNMYIHAHTCTHRVIGEFLWASSVLTFLIGSVTFYFTIDTDRHVTQHEHARSVLVIIRVVLLDGLFLVMGITLGVCITMVSALKKWVLVVRCVN